MHVYLASYYTVWSWSKCFVLTGRRWKFLIFCQSHLPQAYLVSLSINFIFLSCFWAFQGLNIELSFDHVLVRGRWKLNSFRNKPSSLLTERLNVNLELVSKRELSRILDLVDRARRARSILFEPVLVHPASFSGKSSCVNPCEVNQYFFFIRLVKSNRRSISTECLSFKVLPGDDLLLVKRWFWTESVSWLGPSVKRVLIRIFVSPAKTTLSIVRAWAYLGSVIFLI